VTVLQVLSNGNAANAARGAQSASPNSNVYHNTPEYGNTQFADGDLATLDPNPLYDGIILSFDITPAVTGPVIFR
jgi:hypothetical protein